MNKWVLLEHKVYSANTFEIHYDFLVENGLDCLTWKFLKLPLIKEKWPNIAQQTLEATKGSIDDLVEVIANNSGTSVVGIKSQLFEIIDSIKENNWEISEKIEPIETQLEELLEELNNTLRPKIESPIRKKPLLSIAIAAGIGLLIGSLLNSGRK